MEVSEVTNRQVYECSSDATLEEIIQLMWDKQVAYLLVMHGSRPLGFITEQSIVSGIAGRNRHLDQMQAKEFVTAMLPCTLQRELRVQELEHQAGPSIAGLAA